MERFSRLTRIHPASDNRLQTLRPLVLETIGEETLLACTNDIARGDGAELRWGKQHGGTPIAPSIHSVFSSCGAALNHFGPWRLAPETLFLDGEAGFTELRLEEKLRIFRGGRAPNLDCVVWDDTRLIAIESKLCEHLQPGHPAVFRDTYDRVAPLAHESWQRLYAILKDDPNHFAYLDAAQLVRHYFGVRAQLQRTHRDKQAWLTYAYWEPADADAQPACMKHRAEVAELESTLADPEVRFLAISHRELWDEWDQRNTPTWLHKHVELLRDRYDVALT